jgi:hypothetical protein
MQKKYLIAIIAGLILIDIFLLVSNVSRQKEIEKYEEEIKQDFFLGRRDTELFIKENKFTDGITKDLFLLTIFTDFGCMDCKKREIRYLKKLQNKFKDRVHVIYSGFRYEIFDTMGANFDYGVIKSDSISKILPKTFDIVNPVSFLVDSNMRVQAIHESEYNNGEKSAEFFSRIESLFTAVD